VLFNSYEFVLLFLPIALLGFMVFARFDTDDRQRTRLWLTATSLFFSGTGHRFTS